MLYLAIAFWTLNVFDKKMNPRLSVIAAKVFCGSILVLILKILQIIECRLISPMISFTYDEDAYYQIRRAQKH
jgi:hypothetical protein